MTRFRQAVAMLALCAAVGSGCSCEPLVPSPDGGSGGGGGGEMTGGGGGGVLPTGGGSGAKGGGGGSPVGGGGGAEVLDAGSEPMVGVDAGRPGPLTTAVGGCHCAQADGLVALISVLLLRRRAR